MATAQGRPIATGDEETASLWGDSGNASYGTTEPTRIGRDASESRKAKRRAISERSWGRISYYVPILEWLPSYSVQKLGGDMTAALTMVSLVVPQSMSYSTSLAGLPVASGLFSGAIVSIIYSFFGTSKQLSVAPEAALSLIIGQTITQIVTAEQHAHGGILTDKEVLAIALSIASVITFEAGLITFALGIFRLGFLDAVLSRALLRGFISAVALVILVAQAVPMLGLDTLLTEEIDNTPEKFLWVLDHLGSVHKLTAILAGVTLFVLIFGKVLKAKLAKRKGFRHITFLPEVLVVVILSTLLCSIMRWDLEGLTILGHVSATRVSLSLPFVSSQAQGYLRQCLGTSTVIAVLGFLDSIVAAHDSANRYDYPISPNRELVALGVGNLFASLAHGTLPGYGSITRSRLAGSTGSRSQMTSFLTGILILIVAFFFLPFLYYLPKCILAAIVCRVVYSILEETPHEVAFYIGLQAWPELSLMILTFLLTLCVSVEAGIGVAVFVSMLLVIRQSASMRVRILGRVPGTTNRFEPLDEDDLGEEEIHGVLIVRIRDVALTFANAGTLKDRLRRLERYGHGNHHPSEPPSRAAAGVIIFHFGDVETIDAGALQLIHEATESYIAREVLVYWTHLLPKPRTQLERSGVLDLCGDHTHVQPTVQKALDALNDTHVLFDGI